MARCITQSRVATAFEMVCNALDPEETCELTARLLAGEMASDWLRSLAEFLSPAQRGLIRKALSDESIS